MCLDSSQVQTLRESTNIHLTLIHQYTMYKHYLNDTAHIINEQIQIMFLSNGNPMHATCPTLLSCKEIEAWVSNNPVKSMQFDLLDIVSNFDLISLLQSPSFTLFHTVTSKWTPQLCGGISKRMVLQ